MENVQVSALSLTPFVDQWLQKPKAAALLHLFDEVINLIDADGEIISVVQPPVGPGPFSLVVAEERPFPDLILPDAPVIKTETTLTIGAVEIDCRSASWWRSIPKWRLLHQAQVDWLGILPDMQTAVTKHIHRLPTMGPTNFTEQFQAAIVEIQTVVFQPDTTALQTAVTKLAGLGPGFTPAGDDFLVGFLLGLWATCPEEEVVALAQIVMETAVPRTTQLSAAWLHAAGRGEAWLAWHGLIDSFLQGHGWQEPVQSILARGATSGMAALLGFIAAASLR